MSSQINVLEAILKSPRSVFNSQSVRMLTGVDESGLRKSLNYYVKAGEILNPRKGLYTKSEYNPEELACSLFRPSYISLEYVLQRSGVIFQYDEAITCVSYLCRQVSVDDRDYSFRIINPQIWIGLEGIERRDNVCIASAERAFIDLVYLSAGNCYFDNLRPLNKRKVRELLPMYNSRILSERVSRILDLKLSEPLLKNNKS